MNNKTDNWAGREKIKIMKLAMWAVSYDRKTNKQLPHYKTGLKPAKEIVDTEDKRQAVFGAKTILEARKRYESFWNEINSHSPLVFVVKVDIVKK